MEEKIKARSEKFSKMMPNSAEATVIRNYVETFWLWPSSFKVSVNLRRRRRSSTRIITAWTKRSEEGSMLEYLAVIHLSKAIKGPILCLVGPPGVGKTSIAQVHR